MINDILNEKNISKYHLSKLSGVPYMTVNDICSGRADIKKCSVDTVYRIANVLDISVEDLLAPYYLERPEFDLFKSSVCHRLKTMGDVDFMIEVLEKKTILEYYQRKWYPEALYMLAMLDYLSRENDVPLCKDYDDIRKSKLDKPIFPSSIIAQAEAGNNEAVKEAAIRNAIPEFIKFNIVEGDIRNII